MQLLRAKVTSKGQITLPKPLRESLAVKAGDHLEFTVHATGEAEVRKLQKPGKSAGILHHLAKDTPVTVEAMNQAVQDAVSEKVLKHSSKG